jgi:serine phosphatase RsbU (regulator of sigma subunit)
MSLRTKLILAFLALSVVPLGAVTGYSYVSSVRAVHQAAHKEAELMAVEMGRRMELVTEDLSRRVDRFAELAPPESADGSPHLFVRALPEVAARALGETAMLLEKLEFIPHGTDEVPAPAAEPRERGRGAGRSMPQRAAPPPAPPPPSTASGERIAISLPKVIEEIRAARSDRDPARAELVELVEKQVMTGLAAGAQAAAQATAHGLRIGMAELARVLADRHDATSRRHALLRTGVPLDVPVMRAGVVVGTISASLNLERVLRTVLSMGQREQGEIAFAIDRHGEIHTARPADRAIVETLGLDRTRQGGTRQAANRNWVVVMREDPAGITFGMARPVGDSLHAIRLAAGRNLGLGLLVIVLAVAGIMPLSGRMTRSVSMLTEGVRRIARGEFDARVPVRSRDEVGELTRAFNQMAEDIQAHQRLVVERERLQRELELCRQIQIEMLPKNPLQFGLDEVRGISIPAREVGGDFFNYFVLPGGDLALLVGDVSGKGVSAALLMANIQATLRARLPLEPDLVRLIDLVDREIERTTPGGVYVTLFIGILNPQTRVLRYVNAGHNPQFVLRPRRGLERLGSTGLPVGLFAGHGYREARVPLEGGDLLFFYTDGIVETENEAGEMFGTERLEALLLAEHDEDADPTLERIDRTVRAFRAAAEPFDDATIMALRLGVAPRPARQPDMVEAAR